VIWWITRGFFEFEEDSMITQYLPLIVVLLALVVVTLIQRGLVSNYDYQCANCQEVFSITLLQAMLFPHSFGKKLVRCPNCGKVTWAVRVPKSQD